MYRTLVPAKSRSGVTYLVLKSSLKQLIRNGKIQQFCRSNGWIDVNVDQRKQDKIGYTGPERRVCKIVDFSLFPLSIKEQLRRTHSVEMVLGYGQRAREIVLEAKIAAKTDLSILIQGKTGTGKEIVALMIHELSKRKYKPFIKMNCGAPPALIESELFGYERGSLTGAFQGKPGRLRLANGGTILLEEIESLSLYMQKRLLGFLEERTVTSSDGARSVKVDVRIVSTTKCNLMDQIRANNFREDLFYRLNEFEIHMPPLRERSDDIFYLATKFLCMANAELGKSVFGFSEAAIDFLSQRDWSGNILELENAIKRAILLADEVIEVEHLWHGNRIAETGASR
jgi:transcriptional regulator with PAS, ATPase and Fis domain